ncbi:MAG TPA: hypothetical protein VF057_13135 [Thermoanaerobaculia bacterium]
MSKLSRDEIAAIVKKHGYRLVPEQRTDAARSTPEAATPELSRLKSKYGGARTASGVASDHDEPSILNGDNAVDDDETIVLVEPETKRDAFTRANRPKAKVISGRTKKFTGSQG